MAYAIERSEKLRAAIPRIMDEQIVRARQQLTDEAAPVDKRVHDARKRFKETRALLRLVRRPLGDQFDRENAWFRDAARDLASARDADAVIEALDKLTARPDVNVSKRVVRAARRTLEARRGDGPGDLQTRIANVVNQLVVAQARTALWPSLGDDFETIAPGLDWTYRRGRRAMATALRTRTAEDFHEWRKRVKEHWYHMQLLRHVWPAMMKPYMTVLEDLSHALGDHHDLVVLRELVARRRSLVPVIDARKRELESEAESLGRLVYAEKPRAWLARMRNYWTAWKS